MNKIYDRILENTNKKGITGKQLGEMLSLKKSPLTDWKNNKSRPTIDQIMKMCEIFAISADELLFGIKDKTNLTENERELLEHFRKLPEREQIKFIARVEDAAQPYSIQQIENII